MYLGCRVKIPRDGGNITVKTINGTPYVYIERGRAYSKEKKYSIPKRTCIGKQDPEQPDFMFPNEKFLKFFPRELLQKKTGASAADASMSELSLLSGRSYPIISWMK